MKYMGSKNRIAKEILPIILQGRNELQVYIEPFCGGCNMIDKVTGLRIANDSNYYLIEMFKALVNGWNPMFFSKDQYAEVRKNKKLYAPEIVGWAGFNCSYSGTWFGGYAGRVKTKTGIIRDYQQESYNNTMKQINSLKGVIFCNKNYAELPLFSNSIIYCDPPYANTTTYKDKFNNIEFWEWCRNKTREGHQVFISEYTAPEDFECVWQKKVKSSLSANGNSGSSKSSTEKLFKLKT